MEQLSKVRHSTGENHCTVKCLSLTLRLKALYFGTKAFVSSHGNIQVKVLSQHLCSLSLPPAYSSPLPSVFLSFSLSPGFCSLSFPPASASSSFCWVEDGQKGQLFFMLFSQYPFPVLRSPVRNKPIDSCWVHLQRCASVNLKPGPLSPSPLSMKTEMTEGRKNTLS